MFCRNLCLTTNRCLPEKDQIDALSQASGRSVAERPADDAAGSRPPSKAELR